MKLGRWLLACGVLAGCASPSETYYRLSARAVQGPVRPSPLTIEVGPVSVPAVLDRPQLVLNSREHRLTLLEQSRWAAPLPRMVAQTLADNLSRELGLSQVHAYPQASALPSEVSVLLDLRALEATAGQGVHLDASWSVLRAGKVLTSGSLTQDVAQRAAGMDGLVAAHDEALLQLSHRLAQVLQPLL
jgi:uncharacterized lipoprotein YmbA